MLQLRSSDWTVRERAAKQLGDLQDTRAVSALATLLGGRTPLLISRKAVGTFLEELLGDPDAVPNECDRYPVQQAAAKALGQIGDARAVPALIAALEDAELYVQIEAAHALGLIGDARAGNPLASVLRSQVAELRDTAVEALARLGAAPVPALLDLLDRSKFSTREAAARALGVIGALEAVPSLIAALNDPDSQVRKAVVDSLAKIEKKAEPLLIAALRDPCVSVRLASANALGKIKDPCAIMPLVEASKDASPDVREAAWQALAALHWPPALVRQQVLQAVKYGNFQRAVEPGGAAVESLVEVFRSGNKAEREKVTKMLEQIGHSAVPPLLTALVDDDREVRHLAAAMLKALGW
jgi:HEAT repeat protein